MVSTNWVKQLDRTRRWLFTAFLYVVFGLVAIIVILFFVIPIVIFTRDEHKQASRVRAVNRVAFAGFTKFGMLLRVFNVSFINDACLETPGQIIIANHPSLLDVVFLLGRTPNATCVVKGALLKNPFLGLPIFYARYILNESETLLDDCVARLERGESVIIFPEGTRTVKGQAYQFKRGAAYLMLKSGHTTRPIHIACKPVALAKKDPWYYVPKEKISYTLKVLDQIDLGQFQIAEEGIGMPLQLRRLTAQLVSWYTQMDKHSGADNEPVFNPKAPHP